MDELLYYLPEILFALLVTIALCWGVLFVRNLFRHSKDELTCLHCKGSASKSSKQPYLFLLPISFGDQYEDAKTYLPSHLVPILRKEQIPTGRRACQIEVYRCLQCSTRQVMVTDFLQVRGEAYTKGTYVLAYEPFHSLLAAWDMELEKEQRSLS